MLDINTLKTCFWTSACKMGINLMYFCFYAFRQRRLTMTWFTTLPRPPVMNSVLRTAMLWHTAPTHSTRASAAGKISRFVTDTMIVLCCYGDLGAFSLCFHGDKFLIQTPFETITKFLSCLFCTVVYFGITLWINFHVFTFTVQYNHRLFCTLKFAQFAVLLELH